MHTIPGTFYLAPMAEISTPALRRVIKEFCPEAVVFSEMLSAGAIAAGADHNEPLVRAYSFDDPLVYQIVGSDPAVMAEACAILSESSAYGIDINMGCPNHDIVKKGQGARLLTDMGKARAIVRACRRAVRASLSVKMRTGYQENDESRFISFIKMLEEEGVNFITVHPRYAKLSFRRMADWRFVALAKKHIAIPVIGNGDIDSPASGIEKKNEYGCDGIMIGREAVKSPWIFRLAGDLMKSGTAGLDVNVRDVFIRILQYIQEYLPGRLHQSRSHRFCVYYSNNAHYGHELFTRIRKESSIDRMIEIVNDYYDRNSGEEMKHVTAGRKCANAKIYETCSVK